MITDQFEIRLFADYFQLYIEDEQSREDLSDLWQNTVRQLLVVGRSTVGIGTARNTEVPVTIEIHDSEPEYHCDEWDMINECSIDVPSGKLVVMGCTDYRPTARRISISPGTYALRIHYGGLRYGE